MMINNVFPPGFMGGYELGALDVARGLAGRGHTVEVLTSDYFTDDAGELGDVHVRRILECAFPNRSPVEGRLHALTGDFLSPRNLRLLAGEIARFRPEQVLCFNLAGLGPPGVLHYLVALGYRPVLFLMDNIFAGMVADRARRAHFERVFGLGDHLAEVHVVFMSRTLRQEVENALGRPVPMASYVPGWVEASPRMEIAERDPSQPTRFVFASRIAGHKGIELAVQAAHLLVGAGEDRFALDVFGTGDVAGLLQSIVALSLQRRVSYRGSPAKEELLRRFSEYDALLFPTWPREPFGFVVCEAAAAGCLPIMTGGIGAAEWYLDGLDCVKIERSAAALATAMLNIINMPRAEAAAMRRRARATTVRHLGFAQALDALEKVLNRFETPSPAGWERRAEAAMSILAELWRSNRHA
ncbi:MAG TPA: glycosyltransferase [Crenalkalicoccus sp.]|nr:glycosyltransferase [Crenalkalicoccus sp.]